MKHVMISLIIIDNQENKKKKEELINDKIF